MGLSAGLGTLTALGHAAAPRFYPDDPIQVDEDRAVDAGAASPIDGSNAYDFVEHTFLERGERTDIPASNVNTLGEVPDSTWFTNRIGRRPMSIEEIVRGPDQVDTLNIDGWPIVGGKSQGLTPGYRVTDPSGHLYQIKFDPPGNPEMASGAEVISAAFYHAIGYNVVQGHLVDIDPAAIVIAPGATTVGPDGRTRRMTRRDVDRVLEGAARQPNGKYRALASRFAEGKPLGFFKYYGTRPDDPNDIFPHEHRRELRANRVFAAWLNHDDSRGLNSLDMLEGPDHHQYIRHYMFDFGSTLGSGSVRAQAPRAGNEYILEWAPAWRTLATLGLYVRPWITVDYPDTPRSVGRFEGEFFDPQAWKPEYPNPAFDNMRPDDAFWAARIVARFSDAAIRAVVAKARYSEARAADYIAAVLIERRDKVLKTWLAGINPIVDAALDRSGVLTFENAAVDAGVATPPGSYVLTWLRFDNTLGASEPVGDEITVTAPRGEAPRGLLEPAKGSALDIPAEPSAGCQYFLARSARLGPLGGSQRARNSRNEPHSGPSEFIAVAIRSIHPAYPRWAEPVTVYFRRTPDGWETVGLERIPAPRASRQAAEGLRH